MAKVREMVELTLTPMSCAAPLSSETACIAVPGFVNCINSVRPIMIITVTTIVMIVTPETVRPSVTCQSGMFLKMSGKFFDAEPNTRRAIFCSR